MHEGIRATVPSTMLSQLDAGISLLRQIDSRPRPRLPVEPTSNHLLLNSPFFHCICCPLALSTLNLPCGCLTVELGDIFRR